MSDQAARTSYPRLYYNRHSYSFDSDQCPCDLHFVKYLEMKEITGRLIFHFGTGAHHLVGKDNLMRGNPNEIIGITASYQPSTSRSGEHESYIDFVVNNPVAANYYKVLFADVYTLSPQMLPNFDIVTLFHLCEFYDDEKSAYARLNDRTLLELFLSKLNPGGLIMFYTKSAGYVEKGCKAATLVDEFISTKRMNVEGEHETLLICSKRGESGD